MASQNQTVDLTVTLDKDLKASGEAVFRGLGMTWTTAFSAFVKQAVRQGKLPFELDEPTPSPDAPGIGFRRSNPPPGMTKEEYYAEISRRVANADAGNVAHHDLIEMDD